MQRPTCATGPQGADTSPATRAASRHASRRVASAWATRCGTFATSGSVLRTLVLNHLDRAVHHEPEHTDGCKGVENRHGEQYFRHRASNNLVRPTNSTA